MPENAKVRNFCIVRNLDARRPRAFRGAIVVWRGFPEAENENGAARIVIRIERVTSKKWSCAWMLSVLSLSIFLPIVTR